MNSNASENEPHILVACSGPDDFRPLLHVGYTLARTSQSKLTIITVTSTQERPEWFDIPARLTGPEIETKVVQHDSAPKAILSYARHLSPSLLLVSWRGQPARRGYMLGSTLDPILQQAPCNLLVVKATPDWPEATFLENEIKVLVPTAGGPNTPLAMDLALNLSEQSRVTALYITHESEDKARPLERARWLAGFTQRWADNPRFDTKIIQSNSVLQGILTEAENYDLTMIGASQVNIFNQLLFGAFPQEFAAQNEGATIIVKQFDGGFDSLLRRLWWRVTHVLPTLTSEERVDVYKQVRRGARPKIDFFMMIGLAAGIAALGLLLSSPAVIIGAMLVAPLMSAIMGLGLGMIQADAKLLQLAGSATLRGMLLAIAMGLLAGLVLPDSEPTPEILSRTAPSLYDLGVALVSGLAGAYALCRKDVSSSLPGVAIAAALVPPLATVGIGVAWLDIKVAGGALVLFLTNLVAISAASGAIFFVLGFRPRLPQQKSLVNLFSGGVISSAILLILMTWVLWTLSIGSFQQAALAQTIEQVLSREVGLLDPPATLDSWEIVENGEEEDALDLEVRVRSTGDPSHQSVVDLQDRVANGLRAAGALGMEQPIGLVLIVIPTTALDPRIPPTPTPTPTFTATPTPGPTPTPTRTPSATSTPSATPSPIPSQPLLGPTSTATPPSPATPSPTPSPTFTATPASAVVANTGGRGVNLRWTPGGPLAGALPEGSQVRILSDRAEADGLEWVRVVDGAGRTGWVAADYVVIISVSQ